MNVSYNWLNEYIDLSEISIQELSNILTMKTCEVEGFEEAFSHLKDIVVAKVEKVDPHPDADKLVICQVSDGGKTYQIVTGAPNVQAGRKYPMIKVGSTLPNGVTIKEAKLRGVDSFGMLCSSTELELNDLIIQPGEDPNAGLLTLPDDFPLGENLQKTLHLNDYIIEIDNKSVTHRPDLWGHYGIARELSALLNKPLKKNPLEETFPEDGAVDAQLKKPGANILDNSAIAYSSAVFSGAKITISPLSMQSRLLIAGMRPINNIVDVSNYIMLDIGQPNHAFDRNFIQNDIEVSPSKNGEKLTLLDDKEITLQDGIVLIRDGKTPIALGGVMGGKSSEVNENTSTIFLESATFHRSDIRATTSKTGVRTEASQRFEKGQDPNNAKAAVYRFANLLKETCPDLKMGKVDFVQTEKPRENTIQTKISYIKNRLGDLDVGQEQILQILQSLGMKCKIVGDDITIITPPYRSYFDITIPEDIIEEIGRVVGYKNVIPQPLYVSCEVPVYKNHLRRLEHFLRNIMSDSYQFTEVFNYAFHSAADVAADQRFASGAVALKNPVNKDLEFMRISPLPGLLHNIAQNYKERSELRFFEVERIFIPRKGEKNDESLPEEKEFLAGVIHSAASADKTLTFLSSLLSDMLERIGLPFYEQGRRQLAESIFHPGRAGEVFQKSKGNVVAKWGQIHPGVAKKFQIEKPVYYFETFLSELKDIQQSSGSYYQPIVKYPASSFELTLLMDKRRPFAEVLQVTGEPAPGKSEETYLSSVEYLSSYEGDPVPQGKKAVSISVTWRNRNRTLEHDEIKKLQDNLISSLQNSGFSLR